MAAATMSLPPCSSGKSSDHRIHHDSHLIRQCTAQVSGSPPRSSPPSPSRPALPNLLPRTSSSPSLGQTVKKTPQRRPSLNSAPVICPAVTDHARDETHKQLSPARASSPCRVAVRSNQTHGPTPTLSPTPSRSPTPTRPPLLPSATPPPSPHFKNYARPRSAGHARRRPSSCSGGSSRVSSPARMPPPSEPRTSPPPSPSSKFTSSPPPSPSTKRRTSPPLSPSSKFTCPSPSSKFTWDVSPWPKSGASSKAVISVAQDANKQFRAYNEDGHKVQDPLLVQGQALDEHWRFFAVYDGHGGRQSCDWLESNLHHVVAEELQRLPMPETGHPDHSAVAAALTDAFKKADTQMALGCIGKSGSTATVALVHETRDGKMLYVANVGDSRAVLLSGSGARQLSVDHHATNPDEVARVHQDGGIVFRHRVGGVLSVTRAFGDYELKGECGGVSCLPDVSSCRVRGARALVLASDGLWDVLDGMSARQILEDSICKAMRKETCPEYLGDLLCATAARDLVERAKEQGSHDNICALVVFL